uniref:Uncharacterized protein n=1 Tax=Siphoviridae sp. cteoh1 TaxID=2826407 RepID=A0A8S5QKL1_9CAUD|nr:MAG TPA: hypothetical protein [Siphoviridae sp. cteoh1]
MLYHWNNNTIILFSGIILWIYSNLLTIKNCSIRDIFSVQGVFISII